MPFLSESAIRDLCGKRVWERAEELLEWPALVSLSACGEDDTLELFGSCHGSEGGLYALRVRINEGVLAESSCSCPYDGRGECKHRIALLLAFTRQNKKFRAFPPIAEMIAACSPETLRDLVATMVRRSPDLLPLVATSRDGGDEPVRETLRRALSGRSADDGRPVLERVFGQASQLEAKSDWFAAGELWSVALEELAQAAAGFEQLYEHEVEISEGYHEEVEDFGDDWARMAVEGLARAFEQEILAPQARHAWLRSLWEAENAAEACTYFALPPLARELLSRFAPDDLWSEIEATVRSDLQKAPRQRALQAHALRGGAIEIWEVPAGDDSNRGRNIEFLLGRLRAKGHTEEADALIAEVGTTQQQFELKMRQRDFKGAQKLARQFYISTPYQLLNCATQLNEAGASELALQLVLDGRKRDKADSEFARPNHPSIWGTWLCDFYLNSGQAAEAKTEAVRLFAQTPDAVQFDRLKRAVEMDGEWQTQRDDIERAVRSNAGKRWQGGSRAGEVSLALALCEGEVTRIFSLFAKVTKQERPRLLEAVADAIEGEMPTQAIALWYELAEWTIENRDPNSARRSYTRAAQALARARDLHERLGSMDEWKEYRQTLLGAYKSLRALPEELKKAGV